jgi:hypothetical protein
MLFLGGGAYWSLPDAAIWWCLQMWTGCGGVLTRADLQRGMELIYHHFARFGLEMHIGRDMPESKTDCVFFSSTILPTPGADEHCGYHNSTCIPSHAPRTLRTHSNGRNPPRSTSILPNDCHKPTVPHELPHWILGRCHIVPQKHANTNGTVTRHTAKFVEFVPDNCHPNTICILPKSLMITPPLATSTPPTPCPNKAPRQHIALHATDDNQTRTPGRREQDNIAYDNLAETAKFTVANEFVSCTRMFRYLGSLIN